MAPATPKIPDVHLIMLIASGRGADVQWFEYMPAFFGQITRVEWEADTMSVVLPADTASYLLKNGYAREMTPAERAEYSGLSTTDSAKGGSS